VRRGCLGVSLTTRPDTVTHAETIRAIINADNNVSSSKAQKAVTVPEGGTKVEPIGVDRNKNRIWHLDCESPAIAASPALMPHRSFCEVVQIRQPVQAPLPAHDDDEHASRAGSAASQVGGAWLAEATKAQGQWIGR
jgi:hypothetical protein